MALWTLSGIVMLYVAFPELTEAEQFDGLESIDLQDCCVTSVGQELEGSDEITINMMAGSRVRR